MVEWAEVGKSNFYLLSIYSQLARHVVKVSLGRHGGLLV